PYDQVFEMDDINSEFGQVDVAIVLGANDVVNPAALQKGSPIFGMPILEAYKARTIIVNKRSMAAGYAGLDNELFYMDKTMMVFGDAKNVVDLLSIAFATRSCSRWNHSGSSCRRFNRVKTGCTMTPAIPKKLPCLCPISLPPRPELPPP